ncbi:molybdate ABC transporter substrate-binding protein [Klebsiella indica]|uniref:Molybdate ABC transporter substrate-binding protein n=1 Tax=Klebsiella indica TaxID=2582917 RepID=A0A5R9LNH7_9ENTR|nr:MULTISPECIES: molybdate ABC transporter substrate-binding protein [Klebsiella]TLV23080.1 molybdate ABC transporter substrate-binding protein [Klebsiella indica]
MKPIKYLLSGILLCCSFISTAADLHLYAGAGLRTPVDKIVSRFEKETGQHVTVEYGGSGQILARFELTRQGDLFLPGSADYVDKIKSEGELQESFPLVHHTPVMAIRKDKADGITTFAELAKSHLKLGMGDPKAIALGKSGEKLLALSGYGNALREKVVVRTATIKQLVMYLLNGDVDAAVIGRTDAVKNKDTLVLLPTPAGTPDEIATLAILRTSKHPEIARQLADYFTSAQGIKVFTDMGYLPINE